MDAAQTSSDKDRKEIDPQSEWLQDIKRQLGELEVRPLNLSIYKVPDQLRQVHEAAYTPRLVSIGPLHRDKLHLTAMEDQKRRYMLFLVQRTKDSIPCLDECGKAVLGLEKEARTSYAENITPLKPYELAEIMLVDGCFILELFLRFWLQDKEEDKIDPVFHNAWMLPTLRYDLALLENQIPFFVLERLFALVVPTLSQPLSLPLPCFLASHFFHPELSLHNIPRHVIEPTPKHLLQLLHSLYHPPKSSRIIESKADEIIWEFKDCAIRLFESGIGFQEASSDFLLGLEFSKSKGVIQIPPLRVDRTTESRLRNLIALEQCSPGSSKHVTSYASLMKSLITGSQDVKLLQRKGIIIPKDSDIVEDAVSLFSSVLKEVNLTEDFYFGKLRDDVNGYHRPLWLWQRHKAFWTARWHKYTTALKNDYFSNPWKITAFVAGLLILLMTAAQTAYTIRTYY